MNERQEKMYDALCELDGETVAMLFTDWLGLQVLSEGFYKFLQDEGCLETEEE